MLIIQQEAFFSVLCLPAWTKEMEKKRNERGTIVNLDVLIAAFHFGNEHLMLRSDSQQGLLVG